MRRLGFGGLGLMIGQAISTALVGYQPVMIPLLVLGLTLVLIDERVSGRAK